MKSPEKPHAGARKPYRKPELKVYGTVRTITRNVGTMGAMSDGAGPKAKTR
jgi:hypothetical protein